MIAVAKRKDMCCFRPLIGMYTACGLLWQNGLKGEHKTHEYVEFDLRGGRRRFHQGRGGILGCEKMSAQSGDFAGAIRKVAIALYEGEINMVIHANGGRIDVSVDPDKITMTLKDTGKGIADIEKAMQEGYSTAPDEVRKPGLRRGYGASQYEKIFRSYGDR